MQKYVLRFTYGWVVRWFLKVFVGVKFGKADFLRGEDQFIIVANHNSHLDTMTILASLPRKVIHKVKPVAAADHFGKTKRKEKLSNYFINTLLIQRKRDKENPANDPINKMIQALDDGFSLIIFPEGTRGEPEVQQPLKPGVALVLSQRPHVKYVPSYMKGMGKAMPKDDSLIVPHNSSLVYGQPTAIQSVEIEAIMQQIAADFEMLKNS
ncbi:lysophospholipid acyltransferase family protein [Flavobacterium sp.]|uniref:lysophospholipid acyltransferase family protein n=1 Tax=Flavobacterium sp. TaxID=239 RepID=UPI0039E55EB1